MGMLLHLIHSRTQLLHWLGVVFTILIVYVVPHILDTKKCYNFLSYLLLQEKDAFAAILRKMSRIQKNNGISYVVLREK
jgi:hypothetical protein